MESVTNKFSPKFFFADNEVGCIQAFSVSKKSIDGFDGYYISAKVDKALQNNLALEMRFECEKVSFCSIYSHSPYWMKPEFGSDPKDIPDKTSAIFFDNGNGTVTYLICAVGTEFKTLMKGTEGGVVLYMYSQYPTLSINNQLSFIVGSADSAEKLSRDGASALCKFMGNGLKLREEKEMPEVFEYLGWCSWDAFEIRVNKDGLVRKAKEFSEKKVPVKYAIIDDMWGDAPNLKTCPPDYARSPMVKIMHASPLMAFEGDPDRFPGGMKSCVDALKAEGIEKIGLWFPTTGYWYGLIKDGPAYEMQKDNVAPAEGGRIIAIPDEVHSERYFDIFCGEAKKFGCDFVKIDNQGCHQYYNGVMPIGKTAANLQSAIDKAALKHFDGALINCMGMPIECMFNRPYSAVSRCSDDFSPENAVWFAKNVLECAYNGLLQGRFYINDWDMWWTDDGQAEKNALCHAISGGPIYISDKLDRTTAEVVKPLCFDDGRILRLSDSAIPTEDCIFGDPTLSEKPFKIKNTFCGGGTVAAFNINADEKSVHGKVSALEAGLNKGKPYLYYEYFTGDFGYVNADEDIYISLNDKNTMRYFTFIEKSENHPLFIGRIDKYNPRVAVVAEGEDSVTLYEGGKFAFVSEDDYIVLDEDGSEIECERYGILVSGECKKENKVLKFIKYDN